MQRPIFHRQIGCIPTLVFCAGLVLFAYALAAYLINGYRIIAEVVSQPDLAAAMGFKELGRLLFIAVVFLFFPYFGVIFMDTFPAVNVDESGLHVKNLFSTDHFAWEEVRRVENARGFLAKDIKAVILQPRGNAIKNFIRYYPYFMHGTQARIPFEPVVLLSSSLTQRDEMVKVIYHHLRENIKAEVSQTRSA